MTRQEKEENLKRSLISIVFELTRGTEFYFFIWEMVEGKMKDDLWIWVFRRHKNKRNKASYWWIGFIGSLIMAWIISHALLHPVNPPLTPP